MERLREWLGEMTIEQSVETALHYYLIVFSIVGIFLLAVLTYRIYRIVRKVVSNRSSDHSKTATALSTVLVFVYLYLASALLLGSYLPLLVGGWQQPRFIYPYGFVERLYERLQEQAWFPIIEIVIIAGAALISLVFLLNALARLLASEKDRFRGLGHLVLAFLLSVVPVVFYAL